MSNKKIDFEEEVNIVTQDIFKEQTITLQDSMLNSRKFNKAMKYMEDDLNLLYEKTRLLENIKEYCKSFLYDDIHKKRERIKERIKVIEHVRDSIKTEGYISYPVPLQIDSTKQFKDRDGAELPTGEVRSGVVTLFSQVLEDISIEKSTKKEEVLNYGDNIQEIKEGKNYRTFYLLDGPATKGVKEEITVLFDGPKEMNYIEVIPVNGTLEGVKLLGENGTEEQLTNLETQIFPKRLLKGIKMIIKCLDAEELSYEVDSSRLKTGFWDDVKKHEYNSRIGKDSLFKIESESGLEKYKAEYAEYQKKLKKWEDDKEEVEKRNALAMARYELDYYNWLR